MRFFHIAGDQFSELIALPAELPTQGFVWVSYSRGEFESQLGEAQAALQRWHCGSLVDLQALAAARRIIAPALGRRSA